METKSDVTLQRNCRPLYQKCILQLIIVFISGIKKLVCLERALTRYDSTTQDHTESIQLVVQRSLKYSVWHASHQLHIPKGMVHDDVHRKLELCV
jgi:hypothetical protein